MTLESAGGQVKDNYGTTTLVSDTANTRVITVPANRRWWLYVVNAKNGDSVTRNVTFEAYNSSGQLIAVLHSATAVGAGGYLAWPNSYSSNTMSNASAPVPLKAGDYIKITWATGGVSAGGTAISTAIVLEVLV